LESQQQQRPPDPRTDDRTVGNVTLPPDVTLLEADFGGGGVIAVRV